MRYATLRYPPDVVELGVSNTKVILFGQVMMQIIHMRYLLKYREVQPIGAERNADLYLNY